MFGQSAGGLALAIFAVLIGAGGIAAALRTRRRREGNLEAYASAGGVVYTIVQMGCSGLLLVGGVGLTVLILVQRG